MRFKGVDGIKTVVLSGYNPCANSKLDSNTVYQQYRRYYVAKQQDIICPRQRFCQDLVALLTRWREDGAH